MPRPRLLLFNKPFQVLTQFSRVGDKQSLCDFLDAPQLYPAGRLDYDSEGLLLLTNCGPLQARLAEPRFKIAKTYLVQVEHVPDAAALELLRNGVELNDGMTRPADAELIDEPAWLWSRVPPIRFRKQIPTQWLSLTIREGRNRQVRRMTAAAGHPTLRLIRWSVGSWTLADIPPGQAREVDPAEIATFMQSRPTTPLSHAN